MSRFKINYTTGNGEYQHQSIVNARPGVSGQDTARTLLHKLAIQGVLAVVTSIVKC